MISSYKDVPAHRGKEKPPRFRKIRRQYAYHTSSADIAVVGFSTGLNRLPGFTGPIPSTALDKVIQFALSRKLSYDIRFIMICQVAETTKYSCIPENMHGMRNSRDKKRDGRNRLDSCKLHAVALLEAIDASAGVNQLLLAGVERVALGADFNAQLLLGGTGDESVAADAGHGNLLILRMDAFLHDFHLSIPQYYRMKGTAMTFSYA